MYKLLPKTQKPSGLVDANALLRTTDNAFIPFDPANTDAKEFAKWLQTGNKPDPAEEGGVVTDEWVAETIAKLLT